MSTTITGPYGRAHALIVPPTAPATILWWLITAPIYHPLWSQYVLAVVSLADAPNVKPATLHFPGATHELLVLAVDPGNPPTQRTPEEFQRRADSGEGFQYLRPVNICHQFTATDDEMQHLAQLAAAGVVNGVLNPETADAPERIREAWLSSCVRTLAHLRGEEHAE